jgi:tol-pal system protein YbgF
MDYLSPRHLIATGACLVGLAAGQADAGAAGLEAGINGVRGRLDAARPVQLVQADDSGRLARFEVRLARIEEELRQLTGRIEQLEFGNRTLERRLDQLVQDLDQRLLALEGNRGPAAEGAGRTTRQALAPSTEGSGEAAAQPGTKAPAQPGAQAAPQPAAQTPPADKRTLGVVPQSALLELPRPDPGALATPPKTTKLPPQQQYDSAMQLLRAGDYAGAEGGLQLFLDLNPNNALAPNAAYWLAETHYVRKDYAAAAAAFARNYRLYGKDDAKAPDNLLKLGMSLQALQETDKACRTYAELAEEFPNAPAHIQQALVRERGHAACA